MGDYARHVWSPGPPAMVCPPAHARPHGISAESSSSSHFWGDLGIMATSQWVTGGSITRNRCCYRDLSVVWSVGRGHVLSHANPNPPTITHQPHHRGPEGIKAREGQNRPRPHAGTQARALINPNRNPSSQPHGRGRVSHTIAGVRG